jgi:hypothetical protein
MKRLAALLVLVSGCSSAPLADLIDHVCPAKIEPGPYYGGVGGPTTTVVARPDLPPQPPTATAPSANPIVPVSGTVPQ